MRLGPLCGNKAMQFAISMMHDVVRSDSQGIRSSRYPTPDPLPDPTCGLAVRLGLAAAPHLHPAP